LRLRRLEEKDAVLMLEWMNDEDVISHLSGKFLNRSIEDCQEFIIKSRMESTNLHLAIANEGDEYLGTVSLKNINHKYQIAEFAIIVRKSMMGKGIAAEAMKEILFKGLQDYNLKKIFWCVTRSNVRAIRFYDKNKYIMADQVPELILNNYDDMFRKKLIWYVYGI